MRSLSPAHGRRRFNGEGVLKLPRYTFEGRWTGEVARGKARYATGELFEGWMDRGRRAMGALQLPSGDVFKGRFVLGRPMVGMMRYANGAFFSGAFAPDCLPAGEGLMRHADGAVYEGSLYQGLPGSYRVTPAAHTPEGCVLVPSKGHGVMRYASGSLYSGDWVVSGGVVGLVACA